MDPDLDTVESDGLSERKASAPDGALRKEELFVWITFALLGCGTLCPFNSIIAAVDFFEVSYPGLHVEFAFSVVYTATMLLSTAAVVMTVNACGRDAKVYASFLAFFFTLTMIPALDLVFHGGEVAMTFTLTCFLIMLTGLGDAWGQATLYGLGGLFPPRLALNALQVGTGVSGLIITTMRILVKAILPGTEAGVRASAYLFFGLATVIILLCIVCYALLVRTDAYKKYCAPSSLKSKRHGGNVVVQLQELDDIHDHQPSASPAGAKAKRGSAGGFNGLPGATPNSAVSVESGGSAFEVDTEPLKLDCGGLGEVQAGGDDAAPGGALEAVGEEEFGSGSRGGFHLAKMTLGIIWRPWLALFFVYFVTLSMFPGLVTEMRPHFADRQFWFPVVLVFMYCLSDFCGKVATWHERFLRILTPQVLYAVTASRVVFLPVIATFVSLGPSVLVTACAPLCVFLLGCSNGCASGALIMYAPQLCSSDAHREMSGTLMLFALVFGLSTGSIAGAMFKLVS